MLFLNMNVFLAFKMLIFYSLLLVIYTDLQSPRALRLKSDDVNAPQRLPLSKNRFYQDILCEIGGMFAIANKIDTIHRRPWIGFQPWQADGRKVNPANIVSSLVALLDDESP